MPSTNDTAPAVPSAATPATRAVPVLTRHPLPLAGLLALATLPAHALLPETWSIALAATVLAAIAGVYAGFALLDGRSAALRREGAVALGFVLYATVTAELAPMWLPLGYVAHGLWDAVHHRHDCALTMPRGYVPLCAVYDVLAGIGLWLIWLT